MLTLSASVVLSLDPGSAEITLLADTITYPMTAAEPEEQIPDGILYVRHGRALMAYSISKQN